MNNPDECWSLILENVTAKIDEMCFLKHNIMRDKMNHGLLMRYLRLFLNIVGRAEANLAKDYLDVGDTSSKTFWEKIQYVINSKTKCSKNKHCGSS